jgi:hypothetical protein
MTANRENVAKREEREEELGTKMIANTAKVSGRMLS